MTNFRRYIYLILISVLSGCLTINAQVMPRHTIDTDLNDLRNAEAFSQIAARLKDSIFLTDDELFSVLCSHISKEYSIKKPSELTAQQKIDTARHLHFGYNASNQQLRRMLRMDMAILEEMFP